MQDAKLIYTQALMADFKIHKLKRETKGTREKQEEP